MPQALSSLLWKPCSTCFAVDMMAANLRAGREGGHLQPPAGDITAYSIHPTTSARM